MIRLFVEPTLSPGARLTLPVEQGRYLSAVMRRAVGDPVALFNGGDGEWLATVAEIGKRGLVTLAVTERLRAQAAGPDLELIVAVVKKARLETVVEKAAELGARRVRLCVTRRTNVEHVRLERLHAIAVEASEQTGRMDVPEVVGPERLEAVLDGWEAGRRLMVCDEGEGFDGDPPSPPDPSSPPGEGQTRGARQGGAPPSQAERFPTRPLRGHPPQEGRDGVAPVLDALNDQPRAAPWAVLIGPEGGWAPEERAQLRGLPFATAVSLGPRVLRADTAAIAALTLWQATLGDWRETPSPSTSATDAEQA